jgi:NitT/TauT family transport system ATP-binding protein
MMFAVEKPVAVSAPADFVSPSDGALGRVEIWDVSVSFRQGSIVNHALQNTSVDIAPGSFVCLLGPSGCGKSTLLNTVAGYVKPSTGWARVDGNQVLGPGSDRGMVFQQYSLFPWKTVRDNVAFGPYATGAGRAKSRAIANELLDMVGLARFADRYPTELSGGMQQRVGIARAYVLDPDVLLMDEPFGALDAQTRTLMQEELVRLARENPRTVLFITHAVDEAVYLADRVVVMTRRPGVIREIIDVGSVRRAESWDCLEHIEEVMDQDSFVHLRTHIWRLLREQQTPEGH